MLSMDTQNLAPDDGKNQYETLRSGTDSSQDALEDAVLFSPPVYKQRYRAVVDLVRKHKPTKVLDLGCSEGKLVTKLKMSCPNIQEICGVDIDGDLLKENKFRLRPLFSDFVFKRQLPLKLAFYKGSATQPDNRFIGFDFIACVEVIEHLQVHLVEAFTQALLGFFKPKIAVVTTPNADFNQVFVGFKGFRHPDHKFEWTRREFENWAEKSASLYGYKVNFEGIGKGPQGTEHLGCCSQMAVFERLDGLETETNVGTLDKIEGIGEYDLISEVIYPYDDDERTAEEKVKDEINFLIRTVFSKLKQKEEQDVAAQNDDNRNYVIDLEKIYCYSRIKAICPDMRSLRDIIACCYSLSEDGKSAIIARENDHENTSKSESEFSSSNESPTETVMLCENASPYIPEECWD